MLGRHPEDRDECVEPPLASRSCQRVLVGLGAMSRATSLDVGAVLGFGEASVDRDQLGGDRPVAPVGREIEHPADLVHPGVAVLDGVVATVVGSIGVGVCDESLHAHCEVTVGEPFGVFEQHRRELGQLLAHSPVAVQPTEPDDLGHADAATVPRLTETVDVVDGAGHAPESARLAVGPVERRTQVRLQRTVPVDGREPAVLGQRDRRREFGVQSPPLDLEPANPAVELRVRQPDEPLQDLIEHALILSNVCSNASSPPGMMIARSVVGI